MLLLLGAVVGESSVGKSTLLNLIAGLDVPESGELRLEGRDLAKPKKKAAEKVVRRAARRPK